MKRKCELSKSDEVALLHRALDGEGRAMTELYWICWPRLAKAISHYYRRLGYLKASNTLAHRLSTPNDVAQDAFFSLWKAKNARQIINVENYLFMIASYAIKREMRATAYRTIGISQFLVENFEASMPHHMSVIEREERETILLHLIEKALLTLTPLRREVWKMFHMEGLPQYAIAEIRGVGKGTIKKTVYDATLKIRDYINENKKLYA